jgi:hypothetical protein
MKKLISGLMAAAIILTSSISGSAKSVEYRVPACGDGSYGSFKSYTGYTCVSKNSPQWYKVLNNKNAKTSKNGFRKVKKYYCVAMGSYYSKTLGDVFKIKTQNGSFKVIICDFKADCHTDYSNSYTTHNNCIVEFYVDSNKFNKTAKLMGDCSYAANKFKGKILKITKLGNYFKNKKLRK